MKKTNKGFSLVELIIVIAIMAILAGAIAPALIRYIDKSRRSNDVTACKTIKTAIETALGTEDIYAILTNLQGTNKFSRITIKSNKATSDSQENASQTAVTIDESTCKKPDDCDLSVKDAAAIIASNIGEKTPKLKYKKDADGKGDKPDTETPFVGLISDKGTVYVVIPFNGKSGSCTIDTSKSNSVAGSDCYPICPYISEFYQ